MASLALDRIYLQDCIHGMRSLPDKSIDVVITDPPFAIDFKAQRANYNRKHSLVIKGYEDIKPIQYAYFTDRWLRQCYRVLKPTGTMFVCRGYNNLAIIRNNLENIRFHLLNEIIWQYQFGVVTRRKFTTSHQNISFVCKDKKRYRFYPNCRFADSDKTEKGRSKRYADMEDVWYIPREYWPGSEKTPTKQPGALIAKMLSYSTKKNDIVLDPFMGSGQTAFVARGMGRRYIGFEIVKKYYNFCKKRGL